MWNLTEHQKPSTRQDLQVLVSIRDTIEYATHCTYAGSFINQFKIDLSEIPRSNNFSADLMYKAIAPNQDEYSNTVEIWKLKANGDFKTKLYTLIYAKSTK
ncbi:hypothetical protein SAMN05421780_104294 [Flexibacter flexilis DSM 6793]|uniref:Uncharacterized protein n=1 Tax=Flexibacter flexilis DSM 6793 TaxID=927664 RepID=A0A1I1IAL0_9BACT|nr:hypothetical protein [Flexibacter flexilis]SFC33389.1 hypothetical protein SAMN05421780_104294 [Flexibacter flexilis DSM 6793]